MIERRTDGFGRMRGMAWLGLLALIAGLLAGALTPQAQPTIQLADVAAQLPRAARAPATSVDADVAHYLAESFCRDGVCNGRDGWRAIIIMDAASAWTIAELELVHTVWLTTLTGLDSVGADGRSLLAGYRVRKLNQDYIRGDDARRVLAKVNHGRHEILLSRSAFLRQGGFYIYHEIGHVLDERLDRRFSANYQRLAAQVGGASEAAVADGFWLNENGRGSVTEATADAFATWMLLYHAPRQWRPVFPGTPVDTDYEALAMTARMALVNALEQDAR